MPTSVSKTPLPGTGVSSQSMDAQFSHTHSYEVHRRRYCGVKQTMGIVDRGIDSIYAMSAEPSSLLMEFCVVTIENCSQIVESSFAASNTAERKLDKL